MVVCLCLFETGNNCECIVVIVRASPPQMAATVSLGRSRSLVREAVSDLRNVLTKAVSGTTMLYSSRPSPSLNCHNFMLRPYKFLLRQSSSGKRRVWKFQGEWDPRLSLETKNILKLVLLAYAKKFLKR